MAKTDSNIGSLKKTTYLAADSLLVAEQQGDAVAVEGRLFIDFAQQAVEPQAVRAENAATSAEAVQRYVEESRTAAAKSASSASQSEINARTHSDVAALAEQKTSVYLKDTVNAQRTATASANSAKESQQSAATSEASAKQSENNAKASEENALASKNSAAASAKRIEDMTVEARTIPHNKGASVDKQSGENAVKLVFGIPGGKSAYQYAVDFGYTGTEKEFTKLLAEKAGLTYVADGGMPSSFDSLVFDGGTPFTTDDLNVDGGTP